MFPAAIHEQSLSKLLHLNDLWNNIVGVNAPLTDKNLQKLFLGVRDNELLLEQKAPTTFTKSLKKFFTGEKQEESFTHAQMRLRLLFSNLYCNVSDEQKAQLVLFASRIDALGRYVFTGRYDKTILCCFDPAYRDYQLCYSRPTTLPPLAKITAGLSNSNAMTCWLNAYIKFIAASEYYDHLFIRAQQEPSLEKLRLAFFDLVQALRMNYSQAVVDALHQELLEAIRTSRFVRYTGEQSDPEEFLLQLFSSLADPKRENQQITIFKHYLALKENVFKPGEMRSTPTLEIHPGDSSTIDIDRNFSAIQVVHDLKGYLTVVKDALISPNPSSALDFCFQEVFTELPEYLEVTIRRGVEFDRQEKQGYVTRKKIQIDDSGTLQFTEHEPLTKTVCGNELLCGIRKKAICQYLPIASIEQRGSTTSSGHYVAQTRDPVGRITSHNDYSVQHEQPESVWARSYRLLLKRTKRELLPVEPG